MFTEKEYDRMLDAYEDQFPKGPEAESALHDAILDMEEHSTWHPLVKTNQLVLSPIEGPMDAEEEQKKYPELDIEVIKDTADGYGSHLFVHHIYNGQRVMSWCVRNVDSCRTLKEAAKLGGSALGKMSAQNLAQTLNNGLEVASGTTLMLERYGKISAFHSGSEGDGYEIMPIPELWDIVVETVKARFGTMAFMEGRISHRFAAATWALPEVKNELLAAYKDAIKNSASYSESAVMKLSPAVRFYSSDTGDSSAKLYPLFLSPSGAQLRLVPGVEVRHEKPRREGKKDPVSRMDEFREGCENIYAMFYDAIEKTAELSRIKIYNGENCVVSLCLKYKIAKKYGDRVREIVTDYAFGQPFITAYDVYSAMTEVVPIARSMNAKEETITTLSEIVDRILNADWSEHDVSGVVSWGKT